MWRSLVVGFTLCQGQIHLPTGEDEHALLQARVSRASFQPNAKKSDPTLLLDTVRKLAHNAKNESPETIATLVASIRATIQDMKPLLVAEHESAQSLLDAQFGEIEACGNSGSFGTEAVQQLASQVAAIEACVAARAEATTSRDDACNAWTTHAAHTHAAFPQSLPDAPPAGDVLDYMEDFFSFLEDELPGMRSRKAACDTATDFLGEEETRCDEVDEENEGSFCDHTRECAYLHSCHSHEVTVYNTMNAAGESAVEARQAQFRSISQVECLLDFITEAVNGNETISDADLDTCDGEVSVDHLVISISTPGDLPTCPVPSDSDPECPAIQLPPSWTNGEGDVAERPGTGSLSNSAGIRAPPATDRNGREWHLAMNLDTNDGHVLHYANQEFWESATETGGASTDASVALTQDYKNPAVFASGTVREILIVVHDEGEVKGWRQWYEQGQGRAHSLKDYFNRHNRCDQTFSGGHSVLLGNHVETEVGVLDSHEPMVSQEGHHLWVNAGAGDNNRMSTTKDGNGNLGWGLGTAYDQGSHPCQVTARPQADAEFKVDHAHWGSGGGIGGLIGTDHVCGGDGHDTNIASCTGGRCGACPWTVPSGINYDYAIFVSGDDIDDGAPATPTQPGEWVLVANMDRNGAVMGTGAEGELSEANTNTKLSDDEINAMNFNLVKFAPLDTNYDTHYFNFEGRQFLSATPVAACTEYALTEEAALNGQWTTDDCCLYQVCNFGRGHCGGTVKASWGFRSYGGCGEQQAIVGVGGVSRGYVRVYVNAR